MSFCLFIFILSIIFFHVYGKPSKKHAVSFLLTQRLLSISKQEPIMARNASSNMCKLCNRPMNGTADGCDGASKNCVSSVGSLDNSKNTYKHFLVHLLPPKICPSCHTLDHFLLSTLLHLNLVQTGSFFMSLTRVMDRQAV